MGLFRSIFKQVQVIHRRKIGTVLDPEEFTVSTEKEVCTGKSGKTQTSTVGAVPRGMSTRQKAAEGTRRSKCPCQFGEQYQLRMVICGKLGAGPPHQMRALDMGLWAVFKLLGSL